MAGLNGEIFSGPGLWGLGDMKRDIFCTNKIGLSNSEASSESDGRANEEALE